MFVLLYISMSWGNPKNNPSKTEIQESNSDSEIQFDSTEQRIEHLQKLAQQLEEQKYTDQAIEAYDRLFQLTRKGEFLQKQAYLYREKGNYETALKLLQRSTLFVEPSQLPVIEKDIEEIKSHLQISANTSPMNFDMDFQSNLYQDTVKWPRITLITTASIGILGGVILGVEASKVRQNLHNDYCFYSGVGESVCTIDAEDSISKQQKMAAFSDVGWFLALGSVATTYYLRRQDMISFHVLPYSGGF